MKKFLIISIASFVTLVSCGGTGGNSSPSSSQIVINYDPASNLSQPITDNLTLNIPAGSTAEPTQITIDLLPAPKLKQANFKPLAPSIRLLSSADLLKPINISLPDAYPDKVVLAEIFKSGQPVQSLSPIRQNSQIAVELSQPNRSHTRAAAFDLLIGISTLINWPDEQPGVEQIGSATNGNGRILVYTHGFEQAARDTYDRVLAWKQRYNYSQAYSVRYDYRLPFDQSASTQALARFLATLPAKSVDLVGYSEGGLVNRCVLEKLDATKAVSNAVFLGTPHLGCNYGLAGLFSLYNSVFFLDALANPPYSSENADGIVALMPGSQALQTLNSTPYKQRGDVNYFFFAGDQDNVVYPSSSLLENGLADQLTNGLVVRQTLAGYGHLGLDSAEAVEAALDRISLQTGVISITSDQNPALPQPAGDWESHLTLANTSSQPVTIYWVEFEEFTRSGSWQGSFWYDPTTADGDFFPHQRIDWNQRLEPDQSISLDIGFWPDEDKTPINQAPADEQARTVHIILGGQGADGTLFKCLYDLHLTNGSALPLPPEVRSTYDGPSRLAPIFPIK